MKAENKEIIAGLVLVVLLVFCVWDTLILERSLGRGWK